MRFRFKSNERLKKWHDWFVWYPKIMFDTDTERIWFVWLEVVRRKQFYDNDFVLHWKYRLKD